LIYRPVLLGQANARLLNRKYNLDIELNKTVLVITPDRRGVVRWENFKINAIPAEQLDSAPDPQGRYAPLEVPFSDSRAIAAMSKDFMDWAYREARVTVRASEELGVYAGPEVSEADFRTTLAEAARAQRDAEIKKATAAFDKQIKSLQDKLSREERELSEDQVRHSQRKLEEAGTAAENVLGLFGGRRSTRRLSSSLTKRRLTEEAKADVEESVDAITDFKRQLAALEADKAAAIQQVNDRWGKTATDITEIPVAALKKDVLLDYFGVAWMPFHLVQIGDAVEELPGFAAG